MNTASNDARPTSAAVQFWRRVAALADELDEEEQEQECRERREVHAA